VCSQCIFVLFFYCFQLFPIISGLSDMLTQYLQRFKIFLIYQLSCTFMLCYIDLIKLIPTPPAMLSPPMTPTYQLAANLPYQRHPHPKAGSTSTLHSRPIPNVFRPAPSSIHTGPASPATVITTVTAKVCSTAHYTCSSEQPLACGLGTVLICLPSMFWYIINIISCI